MSDPNSPKIPPGRSKIDAGPGQVINLISRNAITGFEIEASDGTIVRFVLGRNATATVIVGSGSPTITMNDVDVEEGPREV